MNDREIAIQRNNISRLLDWGCKHHRNCIKIGRNQSKEHFMKICEKAWDIFNEGHEFYTEANTFDGSARGDLLDLDDKICYEAVVSESQKSLDKKEVIWKNMGIRMEVI